MSLTDTRPVQVLRSWSGTAYFTSVAALFGIAAGIVLCINTSLEHQVIQLQPADNLFGAVYLGLKPYGVLYVLGGILAFSRTHRRVPSRLGVWIITLESAFLAICNLGEAVKLSQHPGPRLGWLGFIVWAALTAFTAGVVLYGNDQG